MADFTAIQIGAEKINVKDQIARTAAESASSAAGQAVSDAAAAKAKADSISLTYNGSNTIIWNGGE